ncbi:MAG: Rieske 2Fe-2S domain-containing protein [Acidobacteria bacterium]|nr:Rieske 2Fe-2S domain-containing protein [Acidobacteriota bacterium]
MEFEAPATERSRRSFLNYLLGTSVVATLAAMLYPVLRYLVPPEIVEAQSNSVLAGKVGDIPVNTGKIFKFGSKPGIMIKTASGDIKAFSASCTHLDCIVQYDGAQKAITCACHGGKYDLTGKNISGPPPRPLEEFTVNIKGDDITVTKA